MNRTIPNEQKNRINRCFKVAYETLEKHYGADSLDDFRAADEECVQLAKEDTLLSGLLLAVYAELKNQWDIRHEQIPSKQNDKR